MLVNRKELKLRWLIYIVEFFKSQAFIKVSNLQWNVKNPRFSKENV
jgi:hypothetical protein